MSQPTRTIVCEDCEQPYETIRSNTKYCTVCRLYKDLTFIGGQTKACWICKKTFAPLDRNDKACADCSYQPRNPGTTVCVYCKQEALRVRSGISVCHTCARDPQRRSKLILAVRDKQIKRRSLARAAA